jgi:hypothetical protein
MDANRSATVQCYSGHTYAQEPRAFSQGAEHHTIERVLKRWREPAGPCFQVVADNGATYALAYHESTDRWEVCAQG